MKNLILVLTHFISFSVFAQDDNIDRNKKLRLRFLDSAIVVNYKQTTGSFRVKIHNQSNESLLLYGFTSLHRGTPRFEFYMDGNNTAGATPFVLSLKDSVITTLPLEEVDYHGMAVTRKDIANGIEEAGNEIYDTKIFLKRKSALNVKFDINLDPYMYRRLKPGTYKFAIIYYCGKNIGNLVDKELIQKEEKKYKAKLYQGYVVSDTIKLMIR